MSNVFDYDEYLNMREGEHVEEMPAARALSVRGEDAKVWGRRLSEGRYLLVSTPLVPAYHFADVVQVDAQHVIIQLVERTFPLKYHVRYSESSGDMEAKLLVRERVCRRWAVFGTDVAGFFKVAPHADSTEAGQCVLFARKTADDAAIVKVLSACQDVLNVTAIYAEGPPIILYDAAKVVR